MLQLHQTSRRWSSAHGIILPSLWELTSIKTLRNMNRFLLLQWTIWVMSTKLDMIIVSQQRHTHYSQILFTLELTTIMNLKALLGISRNSKCSLSSMVSSKCKMNSWECIATILMMTLILLPIGSYQRSTSQLTLNILLKTIASIRTLYHTPRYQSHLIHNLFSIRTSPSLFVSSMMLQCVKVLTIQWLTLT